MEPSSCCENIEPVGSMASLKTTEETQRENKKFLTQSQNTKANI